MKVVQQLISGAQDLQITLQPEQLDALRFYQQELVAWNHQFNLTAITDDEGIQLRHFLDSLSCLLALEKGERLGGKRVIDVGTGAGFPGLVLKIVCPGIRLTLLEATAKKSSFLEHIIEQLALDSVTVLTGRAEELGQNPLHRETYDWAIARAVADLPILVEYLLPLVKVSGRMLAQKGERAPAEVQRSQGAIEQLGGRLRRLVQVDLRGIAETRYLVLVDKVAITPDRYPRRPGIPNKRPLTT
ncbi:MAG: 16S rRNA (guanine(527)-N(7))-methyltransferase RsmG [Anaerolineales bacterium]|nr:MAG: 16S rRNA (guanine(527)-N(7))-methyltransferase RsmG [Anaerolineales bacterium]